MHTGIHSGGTGNIRHSPRNGFTAYSALSPGTGLSCPRHRAKLVSRNLAPASGRQDHTASPSAKASFVRAKTAPDTLASTASHPTFVTIAIRPSWQGGMARIDHRFLKNRSDLFLSGHGQSNQR